MGEMTLSQRAVQLWPLLVHCAQQRQTLTYGQLETLTGLHRAGFGKVLARIGAYCRHQRAPTLDVLVVQSDSGVPGEGFGAPDELPRAQAAVFNFDWSAVPAPTPGALEPASSAP